MEERFRKHYRIDELTKCWVWTGNKHKDGYGVFWVNESKNPCRLAHRISWLLYRGEPTGCVLHAPLICHNRSCVNPDHLRIGTRGDNNKDRIIDGTNNKGNRHPLRKLTQTEVDLIRSSIKTGKELALEFNVSRSTISMIKNNIRWVESKK